MNKIICPSCGIEISEALKLQIEKTIVEREDEKHKEELEKVKHQAVTETEKKFRDESQKILDKAQKEKEELEEKLIKERNERVGFEKKVGEEAQEKAEKNQRLKLKEKDLQLEEIRKVNEDLKRKLEQGSQQRQGEVLELDLEERLRTSFPNDDFIPVPKGVEGADIWQKIKYKNNEVGSILWETKRTKAWSNGWITKLKDDSAKISASEAIIVSEVLPDKVSDFDRRNGIWITTYDHAISICRYVRFLITTVSTIKSSASQTEEEWEKIRSYIMSDQFKHKMQAHFDVIKALKDGLDADKRSAILRWKKLEEQIKKLDSNTVNFYGELNAIITNLPQIKGLDLLPESQLSLED